MNDIWTMIWKESKDSLFHDGRAAWIRPLLLIGILGIFLPLQFKLNWLTFPPTVMLVVVYVPFICISMYVGDAIAGERERHTLETLLASRISDRAILLGKIIVTVSYAWAVDLLGLLLGLISANLLSGQGTWEFYASANLLLEALALSLLTSLLAASGGVLVSLRATTVRQAQQTLILSMLVLIGGGFLIFKVVPAQVISSLSYSQFLLIVIAVLAVLDVILLGASLVSFQRSRLILS
jgi:ABC-2 type transport system permease protein